MNLVMKRYREEGEIESTIDMANCLMLLSKVGETTEAKRSSMDRLFSCKTCNRQFPSFQALGGHRASHKKPKHMGSDLLMLPNSPSKPKTHECSICGLEFPMGQALGGHMRRHRAINAATMISDGLVAAAQPFRPVPVLKKSSSKRVLCLDLNLTPVENGLKLQLGKAAPALDCFI